MPAGLDDATAQLMEQIMQAFLGGWATDGAMPDRSRVSLDAIAYAAQHGAALVTSIDEQTEERVKSLIGQALENGWSVHDLQEKLMDDDGGPFGASRSLMIARTETVLAYNQGEAQRWSDDGVEYVEIIDGNNPEQACDCAEANGQTWSIDDYMEHPIAHPNCRRSAIPLFPEDMNGRTVDRPSALEG